MLSVKKKKRHNWVIWLGVFGVIELTHGRLASGDFVVKNYGVSFSIDGLFFVLLSIFFVLFLTFVFLKKNSFGLGWMVLGGWINLVDRLMLGYVRDYWRFGTVYNNLADWIIGFGTVLFLLEILCKKK